MSARVCSGIETAWSPLELVSATSLATSAGKRFASIPADAEWIQRSRVAGAKSAAGKVQPQ